MPHREVSIVQILVRQQTEGGIGFLLHPHDKWHTPDGQPFLALPTRVEIGDAPVPFDREQSRSMEVFVDEVMRGKLGLADEDYVLEAELEPVAVEMPQSSTGIPSRYLVYPVDLWVSPAKREALRSRVNGLWLTPAHVLARRDVPPTVRGVFEMILQREQRIQAELGKQQDQRQPHKAGRLILDGVSDQPTMDGVASKWFAKHKQGVRIVEQGAIDEILRVGDRAFNLRVADPYKRYQLQGVGFTWSFFSHKDKQDVHVHGAPVVEIYGVLEGEMEIWWKPYYDRGASAWSHRVLKAGDWAEVESLQCHIVHWRTEGKGVVFKAGPGPMAEVGRLGVKGKTPCEGCPCVWPEGVRKLQGG